MSPIVAVPRRLRAATTFASRFKPVRDDAVDLGLGVRNHRAVARRECDDRQRAQPAQRFEVQPHRAVGRQDHHRRAAHQVIAGEQQPAVLEQQAHVIRGVARRVQRAQRHAARIDDVAVLEPAIRRISAVLVGVVGCGPTAAPVRRSSP